MKGKKRKRERADAERAETAQPQIVTESRSSSSKRQRLMSAFVRPQTQTPRTSKSDHDKDDPSVRQASEQVQLQSRNVSKSKRRKHRKRKKKSLKRKLSSSSSSSTSSNSTSSWSDRDSIETASSSDNDSSQYSPPRKRAKKKTKNNRKDESELVQPEPDLDQTEVESDNDVELVSPQDTDDTVSVSSSVKKKDAGRKQKFRDTWKRVLPWIRPSPKGELFSRCIVCGKDLQGSLTQLKRHSNSRSHIKFSKSFELPETENTSSIFEAAKKQKVINEIVKAAEIKIGLFFMEHDIPVAVADHLMKLLPTLDHESIILKKVSSRRTKCSSIIKNVIGKYSFNKIVAILKCIKFSLMIDESTDRTAVKHLIVVVRFLVDFEPKDVFLALLELGSDAKHTTLYNLLVDFFKDNGIPYQQNMVGFASDGASVMMGSNHSVSVLLRQDIPDLFILKCLCHSLALCASYASEKLPAGVEELVTQVYSYFKNSSSRQVKFKDIQNSFKDMKRHKLLKLCKTRWLAVKDCVVRTLEQYPTLITFFEEEAKKSAEANSILVKLRDPLNQLYLGFLEYVLPLITNRNQSFQAEKPKIAMLHREMESLYKTILRMYLKPDYVDKHDVSQIQYRHPDYFTNDEGLYVGPRPSADIEILNLREAQKKVFFTNCRNFLVELAHQIYTRFPFKDNYIRGLKYVNFVDPAYLYDVTSIAPAYTYVGKGLNIDIGELDDQFRDLKVFMKSCDVKDIPLYWKKVSEIKNPDREQRFGLVLDLVRIILTLPHSSAACERFFSIVNQNKTKSRNRMKTKLLNGILLGKSLLSLDNKNCYDCDVEGMTKLHNVSMYEKK